MPNPSTKRKPTSRSNDRKRARASRRPFSSLEPHSVCGQCIPTRLASSCRGEGQTMAYTGTLWMPQYSAPLTSHLTPGPSAGETTEPTVLTHSQTCAALCALLAGSSPRLVRAPNQGTPCTNSCKQRRSTHAFTKQGAEIRNPSRGKSGACPNSVWKSTTSSLSLRSTARSTSARASLR